MTTRAIGYVRVSTDKQADEGVSLAAQEAKLRAYAALYDLELVEVIVDAGASAKTLARPGLTRALAMLAAGAAQALIVAKLDRLTRSVADLGTLVERHFQTAALLSVSEQIDTRSAGGRLVLNVLASVAQWEREAIGERTRAALAHKKSQGERLGRPRYGYRVSPTGALEPVPAEQHVIACAREYRAAGLTLSAIAQRLEGQGLVARNGKTFHPQQVAAMVAA